jgi:trigger factor
MQVSTKRLDSANATITAQVEQPLITKTEDKIARSIAKEAKFDGFRKGKVPTALIKQRYGDKLNEEVRSDIAQQALTAGLKELGEPEMVGTPAVSRFEEKDGGFELEITIATRPDLELGDYLKVVPTFKAPTVTKKEVDETLKKAAESTVAPEEIKTKRALKDKDIALFDFEGFIDDQPLENGSANDQELEIGKGQFIPGFEEQMVGMKPGESRTLDVTFPEDYHAKEIAGKPVRFEVTLKGIKTRPAVVLDDEVAKKLLPGDEEASLEKLRTTIEESMQGEKRSEMMQGDLKPKLLEALVKNYQFDLPKNIVEQEIDHLASNKAREMNEEDLKKLSGDEKAIGDLRESVRSEAEQRVKTTLIIDALAKAESIVVNDQEVMQVVYYEAMRSGQDPKQMLDYYKENNLIPVIKMSLTEDRVLTTLLDKKNPQPKADEKPAAKTTKPAAKKPAAAKSAGGEEKKPAAKKAPAKKPAAKKPAAKDETDPA